MKLDWKPDTDAMAIHDMNVVGMVQVSIIFKLSAAIPKPAVH